MRPCVFFLPETSLLPYAMIRRYHTAALENQQERIYLLRLRFAAGLLLWVVVIAARAQELPFCDERPTQALSPIVDIRRWCLEEVLPDQTGERWMISKLIVGGDGTLYGVRPMVGDVIAVDDLDGDGLPETLRTIAAGLTLPNGLDFYDGALFVAGGRHLYRIRPSGEVTILVDDLPAGTGFWTGGLVVGTDERIYVGIGASCDYCVQNEAERAAILSFDLDGGGRQIFASGLRNPADLEFRNGALWVVDSARDEIVGSGLDEINRVEAGMHFGWPYCMGHQQVDTLDPAYDCATTQPPAGRFQAGSHPVGLAVYEGEGFLGMSGTLLVVLGGRQNGAFFVGFEVIALHFDAADFLVATENIIPYDRLSGVHSLTGYRSTYDSPLIDRYGYLGYPRLEDVSLRGEGLWPFHPLDAAVSPVDGIIYVSIGGGRVVALRRLTWPD